MAVVVARKRDTSEIFAECVEDVEDFLDDDKYFLLYYQGVHDVEEARKDLHAMRENYRFPIGQDANAIIADLVRQAQTIANKHPLQCFKLRPGIDESIAFVIYHDSEHQPLEFLNKDVFQNRKVSIYHHGGLNNNANTDTQVIPRVGRHPYGYLTHILSHYHDNQKMARVILFFPASIMEDKNGRFLFYHTLKHALETSSGTMVVERESVPCSWEMDVDASRTTIENNTEKKNTDVLLSGVRPFGKWHKHMFGSSDLSNCYDTRGVFAIHRDMIMKHPREFYEKLQAELNDHHNPEASYFLDWSWSSLFAGINLHTP